MNSLVTVVTVVYNDVSNIENTIKSVLTQDYRPLEYIVIDGKSTDGTVDIIKKYESKISLFVNEKDNGVYDAMNKAIQSASGEWISFINSGDSFYSQASISDIFKNVDTNADVIYGDVNLFFKNKVNRLKKYDGYNKDEISYNLCHQSTFTKTQLLKKHPFDLKYKIAADINFFYSIYKFEKASFVYVPVVVANYEAEEGLSASKTILREKEYCRILGIKKGGFQYCRRVFSEYIKIFIYNLPWGIGDFLKKLRRDALYKSLK